jgi:hypothetical protein
LLFPDNNNDATIENARDGVGYINDPRVAMLNAHDTFFAFLILLCEASAKSPDAPLGRVITEGALTPES